MHRHMESLVKALVLVVTSPSAHCEEAGGGPLISLGGE
jgi:hypothetical protein